jgi:hypothetical protein
MIIKLILLFLSLSVYASPVCEDLQTSYIMGDYQKCSKQYVTQTGLSPECSYISVLCDIGSYAYDDARYELSVLSVPDNKSGKMSTVNALALNSLTEIAYLKGDYSKARALSAEVNSVLSKKLPGGYEYAVSEVLLTKSYLDARDSLSARKRINMLKQDTDPLLYCSVTP